MAKKEQRARPGQPTDKELAEGLMRRQASLSLRVAVVFLVLVLGLPLLTAVKPDWTQQPVLGFPLSWFILGLLFYPLSWALSAYFVRVSERAESEDAALVREGRRGK